MKKLGSIAASVLLVVGTVSAQLPELKLADQKAQAMMDRKGAKRPPYADALSHVNPFVGTGGHGHTFPGPVLPFGMVQLGPDTRAEGWDGCGGYHYSDSVMYGFSHTHLSGTGVPDYADLLIVPQIGKVKIEPGFKNPKGYGASFSHKEESASPGLYKVKLRNPDIDVRLTATERCGIHEYTFRSGKGKRYLVLDLGYRDKVIETGAEAEGRNRVRGYRISEGWAVRQHFYFDLETNVPFSKAKWIADKKGNYVMVLEFPSSVKQVMVRVGISGTDKDGATNNLKAEATDWNFDKYVLGAQNAWRNELEAVQVFADEKEVLDNFYTALYHAYVHPGLWTDVDGRFRDFNQQIAKAENGELYSIFSLWDTYRGANPLYTILQPERTSRFVESFYRQYVNTGLLPVWTLSNNETNCMIGYHAVSVIADAQVKGIPLWHRKELLEAMIASSNYNHFGKRQFGAQGFISAGDEAESVSRTLEYGYDDWCIARYAAHLGYDSIAAVYDHRAANWVNLYHPESGFFQPRIGGMWLPNFRPNEVNHHYTEANAWQYSLAAPHHIASMVQMKGGKAQMERFLDSLFFSSSQMSGREQADITGLIGQYAHGNEPSHHMAYLYNYCGAPSKTQAMTDRIMREYYHNQPDGLSGNEDCGQMSAWYVLSALGFYPVSPGSPTYAIGRPMMDRVVIRTGSVPMVIEALNNSPENKYIQSITWNGQPYEKLFITHEMIRSGGMLRLEMGDQPAAALNEYATDLQQGMPEDKVAVPFFIAPGTTFAESITVSIDKLPGETGTVVYTTNGEEPNASSAIADKNLQFLQTTTLKARVYRQENGKVLYSPVVTTTFTHYNQDKVIELQTPYANQYSGSGSQTLVDGQLGNMDYRNTEWQGFHAKDVEAVIQLKEPKLISKVVISCMQDTKSWIFHPKSLTVEISDDGIHYRKAGTVQNTEVSDRKEGASINKFELDFPPVNATYVRIRVENYGVCPSWHLGAGGATWIFMDEIIVE